MDLSLRPVADSDLALLENWLNKDYILQWYHDAGEWLTEIKGRNGDFHFITHFIVIKGDKPIGFCQYYDCFEAAEEWYSINGRNEKYSIDYLIGEEAYLRKGLGKGIIALLVDRIFSFPDAERVTADIDKENRASEKALLSNGFMLLDEKHSRYVFNKRDYMQTVL